MPVDTAMVSGDCQAEGVGAGDNEHGDGSLDRLVEPPERRPHHEGEGARRRGGVEKPGREAVGERLGPGLRRLRLLDQPLDAGQGGVGPHGVDPHPEGGVGRDGARDHPVSRAFRRRARLAGNHRLVDLGFALRHHAVRRHPAPGAHEDDVIDLQSVDRDGLQSGGCDSLGLVGQQLGQGGQRPLGLADGPHLQPVTEQHHRDQRRKLEPKVDVDQPQLGRDRRAKGHKDAHRNEKHHPGPPGTGLLPPAPEEHRAAPQEHRSPEQRCHRPAAGETGGGVAQPVLDHAAVQDGRNGEAEAHPKPAPEHVGVAGVPPAGVAPVLGVAS